MNSCAVDMTPPQTNDILEEGLRMLARIIARDILTRRAVKGEIRAVEGHNDNDTLQNE